MPASERSPERATEVWSNARIWSLRVMFVTYVAFLLWITLGLFRSPQSEHNLRPFRSIAHAVREGSRYEVIVNLIGNVVAFVPLGLMYPFLRSQKPMFPGSIVFCFCFSSFIELAQFASGGRVADVDDVILNTLGGVVGVALICVWRSTRRASLA